MTAKILVSCLLFIGCAAGQDKPAPQRGLLEFKLVTLSKSERGDALTAAVTVTNKTAFTYFLMLLGKPHAVDDSGGEYDVVQSVDGVAYCKGYDSYHGDQTLESVCVGTNPKDGAFVPRSVTQKSSLTPRRCSPLFCMGGIATANKSR